MLSRFTVISKLYAMLGLLFVGMVGMAWLAYDHIPEDRHAGFLASAAVLVLVLMGVGTMLRLSIRAGILANIRAASQVIGRVAEGDLTAKVNVRAYGETEKMLRGLERMTSDLAALVGAVARSSQAVAAGSARMAEGHRDFAWRTENQASTLEETASSMEELTSTVAHNADTAREASQLARGAADVATRGGEMVADVVRTMDGISEAARRISDISSVIDGLAFQTNLLALNAAVEAARAGEQGRGFAVVAAEVRTLAQRSAAAAREIKALIGDSVAKVDAGHRLVGTAGHTMGEVVTAVRKVSELIAEIAAASNEQSAGIVQINTAIAELEQGVQQNAAMVQEAADATTSLAEQADTLRRLVERFRIDEREAASVLPGPAFTALP